MKYLQGGFTVHMGDSEKYRENFDQIDWGKKDSASPSPLALKAICGKCLTEGPVFENPSGAIALCAACLPR